MGESNSLAREAFAIVLAGGAGSRLGALTRRQCKPALPFAAHYRNIDFTLSNCVNSGLRRIALPTQYQAQSLIEHVTEVWGSLPRCAGELIELWPAQQRLHGRLYSGTADAVYRNLDSVLAQRPRQVVVLAGDHIYAMDYRPMLEQHRDSGADVTVACVPVPVSQAAGFGILGIDARSRVRSFVEKPPVSTLGSRDDEVLASMGIYVFDAEWLAERLAEDARSSDSAHDFGRDILPLAVGRDHVDAHLFVDGQGRARYWRDVGTIEAYWQAHMELLGGRPALDLHDPRWPIRCASEMLPPAQLRHDQLHRSVVADSMLAGGVLVRGATVVGSVLGTRVQIGEDSHVEEAVVLPDARIGRSCRLRRVIVDAAVVVPDGTVMNAEDDRPGGGTIALLAHEATAAGLRSVA